LVAFAITTSRQLPTVQTDPLPVIWALIFVPF
jgi:hypothetical protein